MAEKKELSLNLSAGGSSVQMAGGEESCTGKSMGFSLHPCTQAKSMSFSLEPCTQAAEEACIGDLSAPKRKRVPTAVLEGDDSDSEEASEEEDWRAVDSQLRVLDDDDDSDSEEYREKIKARYAANLAKLFDNHPNVVWVGLPRPDVQNDAVKEDEELDVYDGVTPLVSA